MASVIKNKSGSRRIGYYINGGRRCPSEVLSLRWEDVYWDQGRMLVTSPKTERHEGGESRLVPIFTELRRYLQQAFDQAEPGTVHCVTRYRCVSANLRTQAHRIIKRAGGCFFAARH